MPVLSLLADDGSTRVKEVHALPRRDHLVGRAEWADINIIDDSISREHVRIQHRAEGWVAVGLSPSNPIRVGGRPTPQATLTPGTVIEIGRLRLRFDAEDPRSTPTVIGTGAPAPDPAPAAVPAHAAPAAYASPAHVPQHAPAPAVPSREHPPLPTPEELEQRQRPSSTLQSTSPWPIVLGAVGIALGITVFLLRTESASWLLQQFPDLASLN